MRAAKPVEDALRHIESMYGAEIIRVGAPITKVSTGIATLDLALGRGLPQGKVVEIYGLEGSGKSTVALTIIAAVRRAGLGRCAYVDAENGIDPAYAARLGAPLCQDWRKKSDDGVLFCQPTSAEQALQVAGTLAESPVGAVVVDSVAALVPEAELASDMEKDTVGLAARTMGKFFRKFSGRAAESGTVLIFLNQIREKVGVMFGNPETTPGGRALKFWASVRLEVRGPRKLEGAEVDAIPDGRSSTIYVRKNRYAPTLGHEAEVYWQQGRGVSRPACLLHSALELGVIVKDAKGNYYPQGSKKGIKGYAAALAAVGSDLEGMEGRVAGAIAERFKVEAEAGVVEAEAEEVVDEETGEVVTP